jgi:hypothetical protein
MWQRFRPSVEGRHTLLFWLSVFGAGCVALMTVTWGASALLAQKAPEKLLRLSLKLPKLNSSHGDRKADVFHMSAPPSSPPKDRTAAEPALKLPALTELPHATPEPPMAPGHVAPQHLIPQVEVAPPPIETCNDPVVFLHPCALQPGDTPMIRNWKTLVTYSLLSVGAVIIAPPPAVVVAQEKKDPVEVKGIDDLVKAVQELTKRIEKLEQKKAPTLDRDGLKEAIGSELDVKLKGLVDAIKKSTDGQVNQDLKLQAHKNELDRLSKEIAGLSKKLAEAPATPSVDKAFMEETRSALKTINETLAALKPTKTNVSMSPPINGTTGRVLVVNLYSEDLLFLLNGKEHIVPAGRSRAIEGVPTGPMQYRVYSQRWGMLIDQGATLTAGETFTLTASAQR